MKIRIIAIGKIKEKFTQEWTQELLKRIPKYCQIEVFEQKEMGSIEDEAERILNLVKPEDYLIALDVKGTNISSEELAVMLNQKLMQKNITFVIGSDKGISQKVLQKANYRLSLSRMTFTHQIARLLLIEQIYRTMTIIKGEKYHK
jgi:23S rRNA (pseudouridine1915-N3)-methyltransferase